MVIGMMDVLRGGPPLRIASGLGELRAQRGTPFPFVARIKRPRISGAQCVAADALLVFQHEAQSRFEGEVRPDEDPSERVRVVAIGPLPVQAVMAGLEADVVRTLLVRRPGRANDWLSHGVGLYGFIVRASMSNSQTPVRRCCSIHCATRSP